MAKSEISAKQVGKNVILVIDGEKHSRAFNTKEERVEVLEKVKAYNSKNTVKAKKELISLMTVLKEEKKKEVKKAKVKEEKRKVTKAKPVEAEKLTNEDAIEAAKKLLEAQGYDVNKKQKPQTGRRYKGEY